jgi:hypothetical protein
MKIIPGATIKIMLWSFRDAGFNRIVVDVIYFLKGKSRAIKSVVGYPEPLFFPLWNVFLTNASNKNGFFKVDG